MKKLFSALFLLGSAIAFAAAPDGTEWENPEALGLNKEQPRAYFFNFATVNNALKVLPENSEYYQSLDGTWKFNWVNTPEKRPMGFYQPNYNVDSWDDIQVPGCWNVQGIQPDGTRKYGSPHYVNQRAPFYVNRTTPGDWKQGVMRVAESADSLQWTTYIDRNEVGSYRRTFTVPKQWKGRQVSINFDGVDSFFYLWINGQYVGFSKNSRNTATFNITKYLNPKGDNIVALEVYRYSDGSMLEDQDMFRLPGIIRSTYLTSQPDNHFADLVIRTSGSNTIDVDYKVESNGKKTPKNTNVRFSIYPVELYSDTTLPCIAQSNSTHIVIPEARLWSAEEPNRYVMVAELLDSKGKTMDIISSYFGIRQVEIRDTPAQEDEFGLAGRYLYVNGKPIKFKGVNRHENNLATGHTISHEQMEREAMLMRRANINHVRNCHYNDDPYWYMVCDKYGIYLEDEANVESHEYGYGEASLSHPKEWRAAHIDRNMAMVHAHVNHPSIIIWSLGNEGGPGDNFKAAYEAIKEFDTSRPVQYERNNDIVDIGSNQYPSIAWVREAVKGTSDIKYPFHISEYAHSMGNAVGNLVDYWDAIESSNFLCGGAIWDWADQALWNYTTDGIRYMGYGGDFGDYPTDGMFCMNGIMFPDHTPKPQYHEVKRIYQNVGVKALDMTKGSVEVFNKNYFTSLDDLSPRWILTRDGEPVDSGTAVNRPRMSVGPRQNQVWTIPYDYSSLNDGAEYFVTLQFALNQDKPWAEKGYIQAEVQLPVKEATLRKAGLQAGATPEVNNNGKTIEVSGEGFKVIFDTATGTISSLSYDGNEYISAGNGPQLNAFRAPVDNDAPLVGKWYEKGLDNLKRHVAECTIGKNPDGALKVGFVIESLGAVDFKIFSDEKWFISHDGSIELQSSITASDSTLILPRLGYVMTLPAELQNYTYYGRGPINNYNDRKTSQNIAVHRSTVADQFLPFPKPQEMANREEIRWNSLTDNDGKGLKFIATEGSMSASVLPYSDMELVQARHPYQLPQSHGTTLHLDKKMTGLGGASCGQGIALPHDRTMSNAQTFGFIIQPMR